jgi:hypothetical protein
MQVKVAGTAPAAAFNLTKLNTAFKATSLGGGGVFQNSQHPLLVGQAVYDRALGTSFAQSVNDGFMRMTTNTFTFNTLANASPTNRGDVITMNSTSTAIHDEMGAAFDPVYGRMSGLLGAEQPAVQPGQAQNLTLYPYIQPPTEVFAGETLPPGDSAVQIATPAVYGTNVQLWKITHNGVDTHPIHFHFNDVQLVNRVSWDGIIRQADPNELGWKEVVRVNPLQDTIVAIRPLVPRTPFGVDVSRRSPDPYSPTTSTAGFVQTKPDGTAYNPPITNAVMNFAWEYVWHCHILSHEEMDMMHTLQTNVPVAVPSAPTGLSFTRTGGITLSWTDVTPVLANGAKDATWGNLSNEIGYRIERAPVLGNGSAGTYAEVGTALANHTSFVHAAGSGTYYYRVVSWNAAGIATSTPIVTADPPDAPTAVSGTPGNAQVALTWTAPVVTGGMPITSYAVQYSSDSGSTWSTATTNTGSATAAYTVTGLTNGTPYVFRVGAGNVAGLGAYSASSAAATPRTVPGIPTAVGAASATRAIDVTWTAPVVTGGAPITGYAIATSTDNGTTWTTATANTGTTATSYQVLGLTGGTAYRVRVAALNAAGTGAWSTDVVSATAIDAPGAPTGVTGTAGNTQVALTWTAPTNTAGSALTSYAVQYSSNGGTSWTTAIANTASTATSYTVTGLTNGTAYVFHVAATNAVGTGTYSASSAARTPFTIPGAPTVITGVRGNLSVALSWTAPVDNGGAAVSGYAVQYSSNGGTTWLTATTNSGSSAASYTVTGLTLGTVYVFRAAAVNAAGMGAYSTQSGNFSILGAPGAPFSVTGTAGAVGSNRITVNWSAPTVTGGTAVTGYRIDYSVNNGGNWSVWNTNTGNATRSTTVTGLVAGSSYRFRVAAWNAMGMGPFSTMSAAVTAR